jgi:phage repressor protein C with HTH and peptisase S24 domain
MSMQPLTGPRAELARLIVERREDYAGLSRMLGRNAAYIQQFIKRGVPRKLSEEDRHKLARYFDVDESLLGGPPAQPQSSRDLIAIPRFDIRASAGWGAFADGETPTAHLGFDARFLKQLCNARPSDLSIIKVRGDSMFPTLADGDDIMVDRSAAGTRLHDGIYVLRRDETLTVKRIAVHPGSRRVTISSDNSAYPSWPDCDPADVEVVGRVVWAGRKIS